MRAENQKQDALCAIRVASDQLTESLKLLYAVQQEGTTILCEEEIAKTEPALDNIETNERVLRGFIAGSSGVFEKQKELSKHFTKAEERK